jgi:hypothetical protein
MMVAVLVAVVAPTLAVLLGLADPHRVSSLFRRRVAAGP